MTAPKNVSSRIAALEGWLASQEGEHFEFKEWKNKANFEELKSYCCALANAGGGRVVLGVTDRRPRRVVGTRSCTQPEQVRQSLMQRLPLNIQAEEILHPSGRVVVFDVPPRPIGVPIEVDGRFLIRRGDSLVGMSSDELRQVLDEAGHDHSADVCEQARFKDLDASAIEEFRSRWIAKSKNKALSRVSPRQLLVDAELVVEGGVTHAALVMFGAREALGRLLGQAEVIFEYRSTEASGPAQERSEYRQGFFSFHDALWNHIAKRNDLQHYQEGLFVLDLPTFDERVVREAVLNAVCHRNYQVSGSVFVRQYPRKLIIESPGGLPYGVTPENILDRQAPRNRRIAETLAKCGLVERSGQGMNLMFERSISQGKMRPELTGSDAYNVKLTLHGEVTDPRFIQYLERLGERRRSQLGTHDLLILDLVHREQQVPDDLKPRLARLRDLGVIESVGRGRGTRYLLSRGFYSAVGRRGLHTRRRGLDRGQNKELLMKHLDSVGDQGSPISELEEVVPALSRSVVRTLLNDLRTEGRAEVVGSRRWARWRRTRWNDSKP